LPASLNNAQSDNHHRSAGYPVTARRRGHGAIATGVEYRIASGEVVAVHAAKELIVSAGAIGSPQLLLLSELGRGQELEAVASPA